MFWRLTYFFAIIIPLTGCLKDKIVDLEIDRGPYTYEGNVKIENQNQLDLFGANGYKKVIGGILINNAEDLTPISALEEVYGDLRLEGNQQLKSLKGLENLKHISGELMFIACGFKNTDELNNLNTVKEGINFSYNSSLEVISGFQKLTNVSGFINILACTALKNITGFNELATLGEPTSEGSIEIDFCPSLKAIDGFAKLTTIENQIYFHACDSLFVMNFFPNLKEVHGSIQIASCHGLKKIEGFHHLVTLGKLEVSHCDSLMSIGGFPNLQTIENLNLQNIERLNQVQPLTKLKSIKRVFNIINTNLANLDFLSSVDSIGYYSGASYFTVQSNTSLIDYCGIKNAHMRSNINYTVTSNAFNPSQQQLNQGICKL